MCPGAARRQVTLADPGDQVTRPGALGRAGPPALLTRHPLVCRDAGGSDSSRLWHPGLRCTGLPPLQGPGRWCEPGSRPTSGRKEREDPGWPLAHPKPEATSSCPAPPGTRSLRVLVTRGWCVATPRLPRGAIFLLATGPRAHPSGPAPRPRPPAPGRLPVLGHQCPELRMLEATPRNPTPNRRKRPDGVPETPGQ